MMRRLWIAFAAVVVLVVAAAVIAPYFVGQQAEVGFKAQVARFNAATSGIVLEVDDYHRGFYSSNATISLNARTTDENKVFGMLFGTGSKAEIHIRINHGPIPFADFAAGHPQWAPVLYTAEFRGENLPALSLLGALKPEARLIQSFDGATVATVHVPKGRFSLGVIGSTWRGATIRMRMNGAHDRLDDEGKILPVDIQVADPSTGEMVSGTIQEISFSSESRLAAHGFWVGRTTARFGGAEFKSDGNELVNLAAGHGTSIASESGHGRWLNLSVHGDLGGGTIRGWEFTSYTSDGSIEKLNAAGLRRGLDAIRAETAGGAVRSSSATSAALLVGTLNNAVTKDTHANLVVNLVAPSGTAAVNGALGFAAAAETTADTSSPLERASARLSITFPRTLIEAFAAKVLGEQVVGELDLSLQQMADEGYLNVNSGGIYSSVIVYRHGHLTVNGQSITRGRVTAPPPGTSRP